MKKTPKVAIVAAEFHQALINDMIKAASQEIKAQGAQLEHVVRVPGSYEIPLILDNLLHSKKIDIGVALGFIERGQTLHGEVMGHVVHQNLIQIQLKYGKPIGLGIIGPGATNEQAQERKIDYAQAAVRAALQQYRLLKEIK